MCYYLCLHQFSKLLFVVINVNVDVEMHKVKITSLFYRFLFSFVECKDFSYSKLHTVWSDYSDLIFSGGSGFSDLNSRNLPTSTINNGL